MAKATTERELSQYEKFRKAAKDVGANSDAAAFKRALEAVAKAPGANAKKATKKRMR